RGVLVRRRVAAERDAAGLTRAEMHPARADLHALLALPRPGGLDVSGRADVRARAVAHTGNSFRSSSSRFQPPSVAAASYVVVRNAVRSSSGERDARTASYGRMNSLNSLL